MKFYKLQKEMGLYLIEQLENHSQWKVWCYLATFDPFGDKYIELPPLIDVLMICDISERTFYRAIAKLKELELFDFKYDRAYIRNLSIIRNLATDFSDDSQTAMSRVDSLTVTHDSPTDTHDSQHDTHDSQNDTDGSETIYTEVQTSLSEESESEKESFQGSHIHIQTQPESLGGETEILIATPVNPKSLGEEKISSATATAIVTAPPKPTPKPKRPGTPKITDWLPEGPWKIEDKLDSNFRDWLAQSWVTEYGGDIHKRKADVLSHFKKDPDNLPIAWERYQSEFLHRFQNTKILLDNGVQIPETTQHKLIANQRAITAELPQEISPLAITPTVETLSSPILENSEAKMTAKVKTDDGRVLDYWKPPVIEERVATPEERAEIQEKIAKLGKKFSFGQSPKRELPASEAPVTENTEEAIAKEKIAKEEAYFTKLNAWVQDPILRGEAIKAVFNSGNYQCLFDEEGTAYEVIRLEN